MAAFGRVASSAFVLLGAACVSAKPADAQGAPARALPAPAIDGSHVLHALQQRHTSRDFSPEPLEPQLLADLLWAANGVNRPATGQRTTPSAHDWRSIDVYVFDAGGVALFDPDRQALRPLLAKDLRRLTGVQGFAATAPLSLLFVADERRMGKGLDEETRLLQAAVSAGAMIQSVCSAPSEGSRSGRGRTSIAGPCTRPWASRRSRRFS
jgi:hypothetical protein